MKRTYNITGMTCASCQATVREKLLTVPGVREVSVNLEKGEATVVSDEVLAIASLHDALPAKYNLSEKNIFGNGTERESVSEKSKLSQLKPLFLIFLYITVASILLHIDNWDTALAMLDFMGLFFIVFSFFKLLDLKGFQQTFQMYDPIAKTLPAYGWVYPFIETALGLLFLIRLEITAALIITVVLLGVTTIGVTRTLLDKKAIPCACLGTALNLPMTEATFIENALMIVMAVVMLLNLI
mgnify:CR=1 FL=1